jgi:hypothetical protein
MPGIRTICAALIILTATCSAAAVGESRNLTESNQSALAAKVEQLKHTELVSLNHGRLKPNPIIFPYHTMYQTILQDQELLIRIHTETFANTLARLEKVFSGYSSEPETIETKDIHAYFQSELILIYDLNGQLAKARSILEVSQALNNSTYGMEALPVRAALAMNAMRWFSAESVPGGPPADIKPRLDLIMHKWTPAHDVFQLDMSLRELSGEYAKLFLSIAEEKFKQK